MKKIFCISVFMICFCMLFASCSKDTNENAKDSAANSQEDIPAKDGGITFPLTLKVGYSTNADDPRGVAFKEFKRIVEEKTNNNIVVDISPEGKLGSDDVLIKGLIEGNVDMTVSSAGNYATYATKIGISALPFLFDNFEEAWAFVDSDEIQAINKDLEQFNIHVLGYFDNGFRCVTTSEKIGPINSVDDMKGLNIRTPDSQMIMETMSALEANPKSFPFAELKNAIADGTFDAQENPIPVIYNSKLYEVQKYLSVTMHSYDAMPMTIRNDVWNELGDEYKEIIKEAALEAQKISRQLVKQQTEEYVALLEEAGMQVNYPDLAPFKEKTQGVISAFSSLYGEELMSYVNSLN